MNGPFMLEPKTIKREVNPLLRGCFLLSDLAKVVRYVGRSDTDLQAELLRRVGGKDAVWFHYEYAQDLKQVFDLDCRYYHLHRATLTKKFHPVKPEGREFACPMGCGYK